jgi:putative transcriptional regulator
VTDSLDARLASDDPPLNVLAAAWTEIQLRSQASLSERVAGALLMQEGNSELSPQALNRALDEISVVDSRMPARSAPGNAAARDLLELGKIPASVRELAFDAIGDGGRWTFAAPGIRRLRLPLSGRGETELLRIEPGHGVAPHDHDGDEYTLVLTGAFHDGHQRYAAGDVSIAAPGFRHHPTAEQGEVCYALAVTYGPTRFGGVLGLIQRLTRH